MFAAAMGDDFAGLHPMLQRRFGVGLDSGYGCTGRGVMARIRRGPWWTVPFLQIGRLRSILVPDVGADVPFTIHNLPYRDPLGRETVTFVREYAMPRRGRSPVQRRFDATMIRAGDARPGDRRIIDYLGSHQHLAVDLELRALDDGSLLLRSDAQRFYEGPVAFRFPMLFSGRAELRERFDDDTGEFRVSLRVTNPRFGFLFGYEGAFRCDFTDVQDAPARLKPVRHEARE
ncbi:DUF4166 domain-containing protein [Schumannella sp. 10F1B-5-1]|nr:DUF4166 domain-containing protein [Schumannella sp. 10F1B-5-1]